VDLSIALQAISTLTLVVALAFGAVQIVFLRRVVSRQPSKSSIRCSWPTSGP
jgi:hypothetical protein